MNFGHLRQFGYLQSFVFSPSTMVKIEKTSQLNQQHTLGYKQIGLSKYVLGTELLNETLFAGTSHSEYLSQIQATYTQECAIDLIGLFFQILPQ